MAAAKRNTNAGPPASGPPSLPRVQPPVDHLQILLQRFESLIASIVTLREETQMIPGIDEWPSLLNRYSNLLSHAYSINASLLSASPHFLSSQLGAFNKVLEAEARNSNLYAGEDQASSTLFGGFLGGGNGGPAGDDDVKATADGLPELSYRDPKNQLPSLVVHPLLPIKEENLNFLGALLRTAPEPQILEQECELVAEYDRFMNQRRGQDAIETDGMGEPGAEADRVPESDFLEEDISQHDILALRALRTWFHVQQAPDQDGNVFNPRDRLPREEDELDDEDEDEDEDEDGQDDSRDGAKDSDEDMEGDAGKAVPGEETLAARKQRLHLRREAERNTWTADSVSAFLHGRLPSTT